ncbi:MAG: GNAT family protein [Candidatus Omnitrophota bacterium]
MRHPFVEGNRIYLRGIERKDLEGPFFQWANDKEVTRHLFMGAVPNIMENLEEWFNNIRKCNEDIVFMVVDKLKDKEIGFCGFHRILWMHRHAEYRVFIGEKDYWDKGYGQEIMKLMVRYGFEILNFNKVWLGVTASHKRAVSSYLKSGMVEEGVLRQEIYRNSRYHDAVRMSMLRDEYYARHKKGWDKEIQNVFEEM